MYGLLKAAAPVDAEGNGTGNPWNENYANHNDWNKYLGDSVEKNMAAAGYPDKGDRPGKGTAFQGGNKPGFGRAIMQSARDAIRTSNATVPAKLDALHKAQRAFIEDTSSFAHNPYGMGNLQVQGTGKTLGEVSQGWKPAMVDTYAWNSAGQTAGEPLAPHTPVRNQFGTTGIRSDQKVQAPQVRR